MSDPKQHTERDPETDPESKEAVAADREGEPTQAAEAEPNDALDDEAAEGVDANVKSALATTTSPKKKRRAKASDESDVGEPIRDKNQRVRAEAAEKRRARREREEGGAPRRNLDASEMMDDALARSSHAAAIFLRRHFNKVQWVIVIGLVGWIAYEVYSWRHERNAEKSTGSLFKALSAETGKVGNEGSDADPRTGISDVRRSFGSDEERLKAAKAEYLLASTGTSSSATLAMLGAAGVAYDQGQYKEAKGSYEKVKQSELYGKDIDVKGRTLEGLGMALEALKDEEGALKVFRELQSMDPAGFSTLGLYHQARILKGQGKKEDATKVLAKAGEKLLAAKDNVSAFTYLRHSVIELYETLDEKAARELGQKLAPPQDPKQFGQGAAMGPGGGQKLSQEKIQELLNELAKKNPSGPEGSEPALAPAGGEPAPAGGEPAPAGDEPAPAGAP